MSNTKPWLVLLILTLAFAVVVLSTTLVRVENERYALLIGMCRDNVTNAADHRCLKQIEARTAWYWHLWHALAD